MRFLLLTVCLLATALAAFSQSDRGTITGTISDPAGAVVAGAAIEARNVATGALYPVASSATGNYTIAQLPAGNYELSITVMGFKKFVRTGLVVEVAGTLRVDATLEVGSAAESVTITAEAPMLKTEGGEISHNVSTQILNDLPNPHAHRHSGRFRRNSNRAGKYPQPTRLSAVAARCAHYHRFRFAH